MSTILDRVTPGFRDPVHGSQQMFRHLLDGMSRPGTVIELSAEACDGVVPPVSRNPSNPMCLSTACVMLSLVDGESSVSLVGSLATDDALAFLRFHTGVRSSSTLDRAAFVASRSMDVDSALSSCVYLGTDEAPHTSATLIVEVDDLEDRSEHRSGSALVLAGPGIATRKKLQVVGLSRLFWNWRIGLQADFPRGIDLLLACDSKIAAIPRSTRIELEN